MRAPFYAIDYCLQVADIHINDVDHVAYSFDPYLLIGGDYRKRPVIETPFDNEEKFMPGEYFHIIFLNASAMIAEASGVCSENTVNRGGKYPF